MNNYLSQEIDYTDIEIVEGRLADQTRRLTALNLEKEYGENQLSSLKKMLDIRIDAKNNIKKRTDTTIIASEYSRLMEEIGLLKQKIEITNIGLTQVYAAKLGVEDAVEKLNCKLDKLKREQMQCGKILKIKKEN